MLETPHKSGGEIGGYHPLSISFKGIEKIMKCDRVNYLLTSGCFSGRVVAGYSPILDVPFHALPESIKLYIVMFGGDCENPFCDWDEVAQLYEQSWESIGTDKPANLYPMSEQLMSNRKTWATLIAC